MYVCRNELSFILIQVGSRRVVLVAAIYLLVFGVFGKFGAVFVSIPDPVIGGVFLVMFGKPDILCRPIYIAG